MSIIQLDSQQTLNTLLLIRSYSAFGNLDQDQMRQAILNCLKNSLEACDSGDQICLTGSLEEHIYTLMIEDSGHGIPESELNRIFDLYYTTKPEGTGIGLPMVAQIIQGHEGTIEVKSQPGEGTLIHIELPEAKPGK